MASSLFQIPILSNPYSSVHTSLSLSLSGNRSAKMSTFSNDSSKIAASDQRSSFPHFHIIFIEFVRLSISKAIERKEFENKYRNIGVDVFVRER